MTPAQLRKIRQRLKQMKLSPQGKRSAEFEAVASELGRVRANRGKEPAWIRQNEPHLAPPLSIPHHSKEMPPGTARSIINQLLDDCDEWEQHLQLHGSEDDDDPR